MDPKPSNRISVTTAPPFWKSSPAKAGTIAKARGAECQKEGSSELVSLSISLCPLVRRRLSVEDRSECCAFEYTELRRRGNGGLGYCAPSVKVAARFNILCRSRGCMSGTVLWLSASASAMLVISSIAQTLRVGGDGRGAAMSRAKLAIASTTPRRALGGDEAGCDAC